MATIKANFRVQNVSWAATAIDSVNDRITIANHGLSEGDAFGVIPTAAGSLDTGLTSTTPYYVHVVDASTIELFTTYALAFAAGASVALNGDQSGVVRGYIGCIERQLLQAVPDGAVVTDFRYDVVTTFTSHLEATGYDGAVDDGAAIGVELVTVNAARTVAQSTSIIDETAATSTISNGENAWDSGVFTHDDIIAPDYATVDDAIQSGSATYLALSIEDNGEIVTAGEVNFFLEYDLSVTSA
jgi:hypothetical protein